MQAHARSSTANNNSTSNAVQCESKPNAAIHMLAGRKFAKASGFQERACSQQLSVVEAEAIEQHRLLRRQVRTPRRLPLVIDDEDAITH